MKKFQLRNDGKIISYKSGAVRGSVEGKGRFDLISPFAMFRLAAVYERGCVKYAPRNWEKGMPISRNIDAALRHIFHYLIGDDYEDNLAQAVWNLCAAIHYEEMIAHGELSKEFQDIPRRKIELI